MRFAVLIEYHSHGAPVEGDVVQTKVASLYLSQGVDPEDVFGLSDFASASHLKIIERGDMQRVRACAEGLCKSFAEWGVRAELGEFYDE